MAKNPKVSIIIPYYNMFANVGNEAESFLNAALNSIEVQSFKDWELIIVDHNSNERKSQDLLEKAAKRKNTRVVQCPEPYALSVSRNYGIKKHAKGEYICCLDSDDKYHFDFLERTVKVLDEDTEKKLGFVTTYAQFFGDSDQVWKMPDPNIYRLMVENSAHTASLFRREAFDKAHGYNPNMTGFPDWNLWLNMAGAGYEWYVIKEALFFYRRRKGSMVSKSDQRDAELYKTIIENNRELYDKYYIEALIEFRTRWVHDIKKGDEYFDGLNEAYTLLNQTKVRLSRIENENVIVKNQLEKIENSRIWRLRNTLIKK